MSSILSIYISRIFMFYFLSVFGVFLGLILLFDSIELIRKSATNEDFGVGLIVQMSLLKLPFLAQQAFPLSILFGSMIAFSRMTRNRELVIARASGVSAWQFLIPIIVLAFILGAIQISIINPIASAFLSKFERLSSIYIKGQENLLRVSRGGLWLRQADANNQSVIHSTRVITSGNIIQLKNITIFIYEGSNKYKQRLSAKTAELEDGFWHLYNVWKHTIDREVPTYSKEYWLPTNITKNNINDNFSPPETLSFWDLPTFINNLDRAGFSAIRHKLYWHTLLASPLLFAAMVLIAATFTLKQSLKTNISYVIIGGILFGFLLFFLSDVVYALGLRESIPIVLAAWAPSVVSALLGLTMVFHLEDG